jgi:hypothetical protein
MNPKQKRTWGTILRVFGLILMAGDVGLTIFRWEPAARFAIVAILIASLVPLWFGTILIWQAKKETDGK